MTPRLQLVTGAPDVVDLKQLARMTPGRLRILHRKLFGSQVASGNSAQARRRIAWKVQGEREGGLPESARQHALSIAREAGLRMSTRGAAAHRSDVGLRHASVTAIVSDHYPRLPMPGTVILKEYRGQTIAVRVLDDGFDWNGRHFTSLSAIARDVTGTRWNGLVFFGLGKARSNGR